MYLNSINIGFSKSIYKSQQPKKNSKPLTTSEIKASSNNAGGKNQVKQVSNQAQKEEKALVII